MLRNYITIALRNIRRNLSYTIINISGLALGITCSIVLFLMIAFHTSFDNYHADSDRICRVVNSFAHNGREEYAVGVPAPLPDAVRNTITGLESVLFISAVYGQVTVGEGQERKMFEEEGGLAYTDSLYFDFFSRQVVAGTAALSQPNEAVISRKLSLKYFGNADPLGKVIRLNNQHDFTITGVMDDFPGNTSFPFNLLLSFETIRKEKIDQGWNSTYSDDQCYVKLISGKTAEEIDSQFPAFITKYREEEGFTQLKTWLQPLSELHYDTRFGNYRFRTAPKESLWGMGVVAVFLIVTACINFVNLTTAVAVNRSKEVGIRKVLGSQRLQLIFQYLTETGAITLFSIGVSVGMAELALIELNKFLELDLHIDLSDMRFMAFLAGTWILVSLISGIYPAFLLSGFSPALALKNKITNRGSGGFMLRRSLVVFQFVISQFLIVGTIVLLSQMKYFNERDLGFSKEAIVTIPIPETDNVQEKASLKTEIERLTGVEKVSLCYRPPSSGSVSITDFELAGVEGSHRTQIKMADHNYIDLFEMELVAGRSFAANDTATGFIVNETLVTVTGLSPEEIIGRDMRLWDRNLPVVGVVKDFHTMSLEQEIDATVIFSDMRSYRNLSIKLVPGAVNTTVKEIEKIWSAHYSDFLFSYEFLDEDIANFYRGTHTMSVLLVIFSCIAIFIGCLGLYGLISFMANQKEKEIGVRKVLGASAGQIMLIFSREFVVLLLIAFIVASPVAGYVMNQWLQKFAFHISMSWFMFAAGISATLLVAFLAVGYRSLRAARMNPVDVLRSE